MDGAAISAVSPPEQTLIQHLLTFFCLRYRELPIFIGSSQSACKNPYPQGINISIILMFRSSAALFTLFSGGMSGSSLQYVFQNTTLIENLSRHSKVWQLAVHIDRPPINQTGIGFPSVTYPLGDEPTSAPNSKRTFVVLHSKPGDNPWDLGWFANFQTVMGVHWWDWLIPLRHSPLRDHSRGESQFELGSVVDRMRADAGLIIPPSSPLRDSSPGPKPEASSRWGDFSRSRPRSREGGVRKKKRRRRRKDADIPQSLTEKERKRGSTRRHGDDADDHVTSNNTNTNNNNNNEAEEEQNAGMELRDITTSATPALTV